VSLVLVTVNVSAWAKAATNPDRLTSSVRKCPVAFNLGDVGRGEGFIVLDPRVEMFIGVGLIGPSSS
jgi:hypothetical protein